MVEGLVTARPEGMVVWCCRGAQSKVWERETTDEVGRSPACEESLKLGGDRGPPNRVEDDDVEEAKGWWWWW
jgi:hypothetical protein